MSFVLVVNIRIKPDSVDKFMQTLTGNARGAQGAAASSSMCSSTRRTRRR